MNTSLQYQSALARYCRTGVLEPIPGVNSRHVKQYRRLVYNVIDDMLSNAFPLTVQLLPSTVWNHWVQMFVESHACQSPQVWYMPREFFTFLQERPARWQATYPFLAELLWFEWVEIELFMMEDQAMPTFTETHLTTEALILNPAHQWLQFEYPVFNKNAADITENDRGRYAVIAHRNGTGDVVFTEVSVALSWMLEQLNKNARSIESLFALWEETWQSPLESFQQDCLTMFIRESLTSELLINLTHQR